MTAKVRDVVLLHGWGCCSAIWDDLSRRLPARFRVHVLPLPGYDAVCARAAHSLRATVDYIAGAAPRRCGVVGWSLGGEVALAWARRAPDQVQRLALIGTTPCFTRRPGWSCATEPQVLDEFGKLLTVDRVSTLARFAGVQARGDARSRHVAGVLRSMNERSASTDALIAGLGVLASSDLRRDLPKVRQSTLVLHGARDRIVPPAAGQRLAQALPHARFVLLRTCAHAPFLSQPERTAKALRGFFDE